MSFASTWKLSAWPRFLLSCPTTSTVCSALATTLHHSLICHLSASKRPDLLGPLLHHKLSINKFKSRLQDDSATLSLPLGSKPTCASFNCSENCVSVAVCRCRSGTTSSSARLFPKERRPRQRRHKPRTSHQRRMSRPQHLSSERPLSTLKTLSSYIQLSKLSITRYEPLLCKLERNKS